MMSEDEAMAILGEHLSPENPFLERIQRGLGVDESALTLIREAMDALDAAWKGRAEIPKAAALPFVDLQWQLEQWAQVESEQQPRLRQLAVEIYGRIDRMFLNGAPAMTYDTAIAMVHTHLNESESLSEALHYRKPIPTSSMDELSQALETLSVHWRDRVAVPRVTVYYMLDARGLIAGHAGWYPQQKAELERRAAEISEQVKQCLK